MFFCFFTKYNWFKNNLLTIFRRKKLVLIRKKTFKTKVYALNPNLLGFFIVFKVIVMTMCFESLITKTSN